MLAHLLGLPLRTQSNSSSQAEADGTKIEKISTKWVTKDDYTDFDDSRLSQRWTDDDTNHSIQMRVNAALSGQHDYDVGDITITIPKNIVKYRDGSEAGKMSLSVSEAPDNRATFDYADMGDTYVLTNTRKLSAASSLMFDFSISGMVPHLLNGNPDKYATDPFNAISSVVTHKNNLISSTSNNLTATFDTSEKINNVYDRVEGLNTKYPSSWPQELKPSNDGDFIYVDYYSYCSVNGNQNYSLSCSSEILNANNNAIMLGTKDNKGKVFKNENNSSRMSYRWGRTSIFQVEQLIILCTRISQSQKSLYQQQTQVVHILSNIRLLTH